MCVLETFGRRCLWNNICLRSAIWPIWEAMPEKCNFVDLGGNAWESIWNWNGHVGQCWISTKLFWTGDLWDPVQHLGAIEQAGDLWDPVHIRKYVCFSAGSTKLFWTGDLWDPVQHLAAMSSLEIYVILQKVLGLIFYYPFEGPGKISGKSEWIKYNNKTPSKHNRNNSNIHTKTFR